jgi:hypothetical protein
MFASRHAAIHAITLLVTLIIGAIVLLMIFLSYLRSESAAGIGVLTHAKTEAVVETTRREFQAPYRPDVNVSPAPKPVNP